METRWHTALDIAANSDKLYVRQIRSLKFILKVYPYEIVKRKNVGASERPVDVAYSLNDLIRE